MPDQELEAIEDKLDDAETAVEEGDTSTALRLIAELREEVDTLKAQVGEVNGKLADFAPAEHEHELPGPLQELSRDLQEAEREEVGPNAVHRRYAKIGG